MLEGPASVWMVETGNGIGDTMCNCPENGPISLRLVCHHSFLISISHCLWGGVYAWRSEDNFMESVLFPPLRGFWAGTRNVRLPQGAACCSAPC